MLFLINEARRRFGLPGLRDLPRGWRYARGLDPISRALSGVTHQVRVTLSGGKDWVAVTDPAAAQVLATIWGRPVETSVDGGTTYVSLHPILADWIVRFHAGQLPRYDLAVSPREATIRQAALAKVNAARVVLGLTPLGALPEGVPADPTHCPIGRSLRQGLPNAKVRAATIELGPGEERFAPALALVWGTSHQGSVVVLPDEIQRFVSLLDGTAKFNP